MFQKCLSIYNTVALKRNFTNANSSQCTLATFLPHLSYLFVVAFNYTMNFASCLMFLFCVYVFFLLTNGTTLKSLKWKVQQKTAATTTTKFYWWYCQQNTTFVAVHQRWITKGKVHLETRKISTQMGYNLWDRYGRYYSLGPSFNFLNWKVKCKIFSLV